MALAHCNLGKFLGVGRNCFPPPLDVPTFSAMCLHVQRRERTLVAEGGTLRGPQMFRQISSRIRLPRNSRDLLHGANLRHGTDGFTSPPKEGVLRIFFLLLYGHIMSIPQLTSKGQQNILIGIYGDTANFRNFTYTNSTSDNEMSKINAV
jgi:hypothetical protein